MLQNALASTAPWLTGDREAMKLQIRAAKSDVQPNSSDPASTVTTVAPDFKSTLELLSALLIFLLLERLKEQKFAMVLLLI